MPDASSVLPHGVGFGVLPALFFETAPFDLVFSSSAAVFSRAVSTSSDKCIPAVSWWARAVVESMLTGLEPPDHALELLPQPLGVRAVLADWQVRLDKPRRSTGS